MKQKLTVGLVSHLFQDYNLGCVALSIANVKLLDETFAKMGVKAHYVVLITESFPEAPLEQFTDNSYEYRYYPRLRQTLKAPWKLFKTKIFDDCDLIINLCGGDGYTDIYGFVRLVAESQVAYVAAKKGKRVIYAPQTIGPFNKAISRKVAKATLGKVAKVFVRDTASYECCQALGLSKHTDQVIDVAFALPYSPAQKKTEKLQLGLNVSGLLYHGGYNQDNYFNLSIDYKAFIRQLLERLCQMEEIEVHLIPHVNSDENAIDDDYRVCQQLKEEFPQVVLAPRFTSPIDAKSYISGMDVFSGARMHSTIGAFSSGVPVIPVAYSRKFNGLYDTLDYPYYIDAKSEITVEQALEQFFTLLGKKDEMKARMNRGIQIYSDGLKTYQDFLEQIVQTIE